MDEKALFYERFADQFDAYANPYDTSRRVEVVFDQLLRGIDLNTKLVLDAGCGTGWFSERAVMRGAEVVSLDLGPKLLHLTKKKSGSTLVQGDALQLPFHQGVFDFVISSEMIEHTISPRRAVLELLRVCKSGDA